VTGKAAPDRLRALQLALGRPAPFTPHDAPFWDDPYISERMLEAHLDPETDAATRRPATVAATVAHLVESMALQPGDRLLDLGCGPGLYALPFGRLGLRVTGIDLSARSISHARNAATRERVSVECRVGDYCRDDLGGPFDGAVLIYLDFGVLEDTSRDALLDRLRSAIRPGGSFAFDVHGRARPRPPDAHVSIASQSHGFWRPNRHLAIETTYRYGGDIDLAQTAVVEEDGAVTVYRVWDRAYTIGELRPVLGRHGFSIERAWSDLTGTPWRRSSPTLAVLARRRRR
jgi:SAM-dependent methyltransferase